MREHIFIYISKQEVVIKTHAEFPLFMQETTKLLITCVILVSTILHFRFQFAYRTLIAREKLQILRHFEVGRFYMQLNLYRIIMKLLFEHCVTFVMTTRNALLIVLWRWITDKSINFEVFVVKKCGIIKQFALILKLHQFKTIYSKYSSALTLSTDLKFLGSAPGSALEHCIGPHARKHKNNLFLHTSLQIVDVTTFIHSCYHGYLTSLSRMLFFLMLA